MHLPISLGKITLTIQWDSYVASNFALPAEGLLGLLSLKSIRMGIISETKTVKFQEKNLGQWKSPRAWLALGKHRKSEQWGNLMH